MYIVCMQSNDLQKLSTVFSKCFVNSLAIAHYKKGEGEMILWSGYGRIADLSFQFNEDGLFKISLTERKFDEEGNKKKPKALFNFRGSFNPFAFSRDISKVLTDFVGSEVNFTCDKEPKSSAPYPK